MMIDYSAYTEPVITPRDVAKRFLKIRLVVEPVEAKKLLQAAAIKGIGLRALTQAKRELRIQVKRDGPVVAGQPTWRWHLPAF